MGSSPSALPSSRTQPLRIAAAHFYSRLLFTRELLPLLSHSPHPRVLSILDPTHSPGKLDYDDLDLRRTFSLPKCATHTTTMTNVAFEVRNPSLFRYERELRRLAGPSREEPLNVVHPRLPRPRVRLSPSPRHPANPKNLQKNPARQLLPLPPPLGLPSPPLPLWRLGRRLRRIHAPGLL